MTLIEHLEELRRRLLFCVAAVTVGTAVAFAFHDPILALLLRPLPAQAGALGNLGGGHRIAVTGVGEAFAVVLKLSLAAGMALATPVWLYHLCAFVAPALRGRERRYALPFALLGAALFVTGLGVGFVTLRYPITWLLSFSERSFVEIITADNYFTFVAYFLLAFGADPYSPLILGVTFTVLFFVSTGLIRFVGPVSTVEAIQITPPGVLAGSGGAVERAG